MQDSVILREGEDREGAGGHCLIFASRQRGGSQFL